MEHHNTHENLAMSTDFQYWLRASIGFMFVAIPLFFWPWGTVPYEIPKVWLLIVCVQLLLTIFIIIISKTILAHNHQLRLNAVNKPLMFIIGIFWLVAIFASIHGENFAKSLLGNYYRLDGLLPLTYLMLFAWLIAANWQPAWRKKVAQAVFIGAYLTAFWAVLLQLTRFFGLNLSVFWEGAIGTSFGNPNFMAGYLAVTMPLSWYFLKQKPGPLACRLLNLSVIIAGILLTKSVAGIMIVICWVILELGLNSKNIKASLGTLFVLSAIIFSFIFFYHQKYPTDFSVESRGRIFTKLWMAAQQKPVLGYGWANVSTAFRSVHWPPGQNIDQDIYVDKAHSTLLEILINTGGIGLTCYLLIVLYLYYLLFQRLKSNPISKKWTKVVFITLSLYLIHSQTNVISVSEELIFWTMLGIAAQSQ